MQDDYPFRIQCNDDQDTLTIFLNGSSERLNEIDITVGLEEVDMEHVNTIIFDMEELIDVDSRVMGKLMALKADPRLSNCIIEFQNVPHKIRKIFQSVGFDTFFPINVGPSQRIAYHQFLENYIDHAEKIRQELIHKDEIIKNWNKHLEKKVLERTRELENMKEELIHSEKVAEVGRVSAGVAHEFNNIIAGIKGYAELALQRKDPATIEKALKVVIDQSKRAKKITDSLLSFSRKKPPVKKPASINQIIEELLVFLQKQLEMRRIVVTTSLSGKDVSEIDKSQISQVFMNMVTNAMHSMPEGGKLHVCTHNKNNMIKVDFIDTGVGIKEADLKKIFTPFFTTKGAMGGGSEEGTGLGLSVSQGIIISHGGYIEVNSREGKGTYFSIFLPCTDKKPDDDEGSSILTKDSAPNASPADAPVLIVDDEESIRTLLFDYLSTKGYKVLQAENGKEAIEIFTNEKPYYIFLDILMPDMNGLDVFLEMKSIRKDFETCIVTGQAGEHLEEILNHLNKIAKVEVITKPFKLAQIAAFMEKHAPV